MEDRMLRLDEINPRSLIILLLKNVWVVVALCISVLLCYTSVCRLFYTPQFTSSATFMVSAKDSTSAYNSLTTTQSMASVFAEVFQSNVLREKIQAEMPEGHFDGTVNTTTIPETNLLIVTATSPEPDMSFQALTLAVKHYSTVSEYLFANAQLEVIKDPVIPVTPSNPLNIEGRYPLVVLIAACLGVFSIVVVYVLRKTVKTPEAARRNIDARLLRTIHHEEKNKTVRAKFRRKNIAPLISNPLISKGFIEDNLSLCSALEYHARKRGQKVILITSVGENEGKSTVAANLALAMAEKGRRVVLLDCDFRKPSLHKIFEIQPQPERTLTAYLMHQEMAVSACLTEDKKHSILLGISQSPGKSVTKLLNNGRLPALLQQLRSEVDYVIMDTSPMLAAADAEIVATMADTAVLVARADLMPVMSINEGLDRLRKSVPEVCGVVLNNYR